MERAKLVYLAGPVRSLGRTAAIGIRQPLEIYFLRRGMVTFNPPGAWSCDMGDPSEMTIKFGNDLVLSASNIMAVMYIPGVHSVGTDEEMKIAASLRIPIIVVVHDREDVTDAIAWSNPLIGQAQFRGSISVEYAILKGSKLDTVTVISYEAYKEASVA